MEKLSNCRLVAAMTRGGGTYGRLCLVRYEHPLLFFGACMLVAALLVLSFIGVAHPAHANEFDDIANGIREMVPWRWSDDLIKSALSMVNMNTDYLTQSFNAILGKDSGAYAFISSVNTTVVKPIAVAVLAIVFLVEVAKIANDFESRGALPPFKDIIFMWICCAVCIFILNKSFEFCEQIFNLFNALVTSTMDMSTPQGLSYVETDSEFSRMLGNVAECLGVGYIAELLLGIILFLECAVVTVVTYFSLLARGFQTYVYAALSPIMLAFLGSEKTQQWGISFIKSFLALCLTGLIMAISIKLLPLAALGVAQSGPDGIGGFFMIVATFGVYIKAMASAGSWAKEIIGG